MNNAVAVLNDAYSSRQRPRTRATRISCPTLYFGICTDGGSVTWAGVLHQVTIRQGVDVAVEHHGDGSSRDEPVGAGSGAGENDHREGGRARRACNGDAGESARPTSSNWIFALLQRVAQQLRVPSSDRRSMSVTTCRSTGRRVSSPWPASSSSAARCDAGEHISQRRRLHDGRQRQRVVRRVLADRRGAPGGRLRLQGERHAAASPQLRASETRTTSSSRQDAPRRRDSGRES